MAKKKDTSAPQKMVTKKVVKKATSTKRVADTKKKTAIKKAAKNATAAKTAAKKKPITKKETAQLLADAIVHGILEVKGRNISILNLKSIQNRVCDYFIICQADSNTQVNAIAGSVEEMVKKATGERPYRKEGFQNAEWILIDYVTVVVHIFQSQIRNYYNLESLWADAEVKEIGFE
ncbi:MAG: ribosome silencing factor [Bacteroidota bacterium]